MTSKHHRTDSSQNHGHHPSSLAEAIVHSINPFAAAAANKDAFALKEDGTQTMTGGASAGPHKDKDDSNDSDASNSSTKGSRRRSRGSALRSLSPFRFHSSKRSSSRTRLRVSGDIEHGEDSNTPTDAHAASEKPRSSWSWRRRSRRGSNETVTSANSSKLGRSSSNRDATPDVDGDDHSLDEVETEREGRMGSWTRICPRNTAFSSSAAAEDSEDTEEEGETGAPRPPPKDASTVQKKDTSKAPEDDAAQAEPTAEDEEEEEEEEEEIDIELLDNTLFNAGCTDLHNDWRDAHEYGEHHNWEGYDEDGIARPELLQREPFGDEIASMVPYADPNHIGDISIPDDADHLLNAPNLVLSPGQLLDDPCGGGSARITPVLPVASGGNAAAGSQGGDGKSTDPSTADTATGADSDSKAPRPSVSSASAGDRAGSSSSTATKEALRRKMAREGTLSSIMGSQVGAGDRALRASRPVFERNRCTITLLHGQYEDKLAAAKRPKRYVVASDGSAEALYAIEWTIGTVMRDGDETMIVSVMETDTKLDAVDHVFEDKHTRMQHQKIRQEMALILARQATNLLQRTRLGVKIVCQALHATNSRRMLIDLTDYFSPTLVIVGSRGIGSLKGILLGSTSHYLLQKCSVPVMVARRRLRLPALPRGKADVVQSVRRKHLRLDEASIDKETPPTPEEEGENPIEGGQGAAKEGAEETADAGSVKDDATSSRSDADTEATAGGTISSSSASDGSSLATSVKDDTKGEDAESKQ